MMAGATLTVMVNVFVVLSTPPLAVPPSSCTITVIVTTPFVVDTGVKLSVPVVLFGV